MSHQCDAAVQITHATSHSPQRQLTNTMATGQDIREIIPGAQQSYRSSHSQGKKSNWKRLRVRLHPIRIVWKEAREPD